MNKMFRYFNMGILGVSLMMPRVQADMASINPYLVGGFFALGMVSFSAKTWMRYKIFVEKQRALILYNQQLSQKNPGTLRWHVYEPSEIKVNFSHVAGMPEIIDEVYDIIDFLRDAERFIAMGVKMPKGILLTGAPGNGKTLLARAIAGEVKNCHFISVNASEFSELYVGSGALRIRELFEEARKHSPCVIFIDEIDAIGHKREAAAHAGTHEYDQTLNQLLVEMDGFDTNKHPIIVVAATNRPDILDSALLRPGRFDRKLEVPYPNLASRQTILQLHGSYGKVDPELDWHELACMTSGFSGAQLANLVNEALILATKRELTYATMAEFDEARDKIIMGTEHKTLQRHNDELRKTAYHEAGHALLHILLPDAPSLYKVTVLARGHSLGATYPVVKHEKVDDCREEYIARIMICLGGRIAEELVFNKSGSGAHADFKMATQLAHLMVTEFGMSKLGPIIYNDPYGVKYSDDTKRRIDEEVQQIIQECYKNAQELLEQHRDKLEKLAEKLLESETLSAQEIYELLEIQR